MLSVESVRSDTNTITQVDGGSGYIIGVDDFVDDGSLLDDINFDDLFVGIEDGDLADLDMDLADFSSVEESTSYSPDHLLNSSSPASGSASASGESCVEEEKKEKVEVAATVSGSSRRKSTSSGSAKLAHGKRKVKVDWTPELHRRFVQAVEQLGVDKAVPSRILELMGIDCLTRHNIASHLQKYRSHRKHMLAREAANWTQRRQIYSGGRSNAGGVANGGGVVKREMAPWVVPTIGFPPPGAVPTPFRPFHVWGHPHPHPVDQPPPPMVQVWPKHLVRSPAPPPPWMPPAGAPPPNRPPYWFPHHSLLGGSHMTQGTPYYPQPFTPAHRFHAPVPAVPVPGIPQPPFKADANVHTFLPGHLHIDFHIPSKESIDAALEDVLEQPWLPLPLGLKAPSTDSVLVELHRQGISKIPPSCA